MNSSNLPDYLTSFDWAVVRVATYVSGATPLPRLLFGSISILTRDRPRPTSQPSLESFKTGKGRHGKVFVRRTVLSVNDALNWYRSAALNSFLTPVPTDPSEVDTRLDGTPIAPTDFVDDPKWPMLGVPVGLDSLFGPGDPGDPAPFIGSGSGSTRIHRRFGVDDDFENVTADLQAIRFLKRRLHVDLADYSEYLGGLVLIAPDPILRRIRHYEVQGKDGKPSSRHRVHCGIGSD